MIIEKDTIHEKMIEGETAEAIGMLLKLAKKYNSSLYDEAIMLSSRFNSLNKEITSGIINDNSAKVNLNRISFSLAALISKVQGSWKLKVEFDEAIENIESEMKKILFLSANPKNSDPLRLGEEVRKIEEVLKGSKNRDHFNFVQKWALQIPDLNSALLEEKPNIIHFSGHGSKLGRIYLENPMGQGIEIPAKALAELFKLFKKEIECVILNACYSEHQAQEISKHINYVIGMSADIPDQAAIQFSGAFYNGLANGRDIEFSFQLAKITINLFGLRGDQMPILIKKL